MHCHFIVKLPDQLFQHFVMFYRWTHGHWYCENNILCCIWIIYTYCLDWVRLCPLPTHSRPTPCSFQSWSLGSYHNGLTAPAHSHMCGPRVFFVNLEAEWTQLWCSSLRIDQNLCRTWGTNTNAAYQSSLSMQWGTFECPWSEGLQNLSHSCSDTLCWVPEGCA